MEPQGAFVESSHCVIPCSARVSDPAETGDRRSLRLYSGDLRSVVGRRQRPAPSSVIPVNKNLKGESRLRRVNYWEPGFAKGLVRE